MARKIVWTIEERNIVALEAAIIKEKQPHLSLLNLIHLAQNHLPKERQRKIKDVKNVPYLVEILTSLTQPQSQVAIIPEPIVVEEPKPIELPQVPYLYYLNCFSIGEQKRKWVAQNDAEYCLVEDRGDPNTVSFEQKEDALELLKTIHFAKKSKFNENQYVIFTRKCKNTKRQVC
jgi:hypothetical protein